MAKTPVKIKVGSDVALALREAESEGRSAELDADGVTYPVGPRLEPAPRPAKRELRGKPTSADDPLWRIVGIGHSQGPNDVASNKHKYLAEAYADKH